MPRRRGIVSKREYLPDPVFGDPFVTRFINIIMLDGKKEVAEKIVYGSLNAIEERTKEDPLRVFRRAIENCQPMLEVKSRRVGGANYQVPVEVRADRRMSLAMRWLVEFSRARAGRSMEEKLANEIIEASLNRGGAVKRRDDVHRMAEANRAFAHYRW